MKNTEDILDLLDRLDNHIADDFESQDLDFKQWNERSSEENIKKMITYAVCMANGGGGSVVFGVADKVKGKDYSIVGVPEGLPADDFQKRIYERTSPHLTPVFEKLVYHEKQLLIMHVYPGMPPYTTSDGSASIRLGKDCVPFTGELRRKMMDSSGQMDFTAEVIFEDWKKHFSPSAMERIREIMQRERVDPRLLAMEDEELLRSIGAFKGEYLTKGSLLLVGKSESIAQFVPQHKWSFRKMISDMDYTHRHDGTEAIPIALHELERYIAVDNPVVTVESGLVHPEFSTYPTIALREALLNAFGHRDYRMNGTMLLKQYRDKLILTNPGVFIGGITPKNILHHPPVARNDHLMDLLDRLKLVNRSNLGVSRIFSSLLMEGKEPPSYREVGANIELTFVASPLKEGFINLIKQVVDEGNYVDVDHLLILQYLIRHEQIDVSTAAEVSQRSPEQARELLSVMSGDFNLLDSIGSGRGRYYTLSRRAYELMEDNMRYERQQLLDREAMKIRILTILKTRNLSNKEIRQLTGLTSKQVQRLIKEMETDGVIVTGKGPATKYVLEK
ncbi:RNA-binding domain-containing protein [Sporosarcina sp. FSL K6-3457]|uniref:RNA-binding domain-containing protein n=1 Tax=Sporosarcina sp. FSL K6-3457 TaxID=2978204 RepID=UPI0030F7C2DE